MIQIESLRFDYLEKAGVLSDISLSILKGERVGIAGPNGAGKTTLFHLLCDILKPASGVMRINGSDVEPGKFNPDIGFIFQNPDDQLFNATVFDDIAFGPVNLGLERDEVMGRVTNAMEITGTGELKERPPHHLSGGEKRMVAIASVLSMNPQVVILDEPSSNLDMRTRRKLIEFINSGIKTALVSSHDLEFILETCDRVVIIDGGRIEADGSSREIMNDEGLMLNHGLERPHSLMHLMKDHNHG